MTLIAYSDCGPAAVRSTKHQSTGRNKEIRFNIHLQKAIRRDILFLLLRDANGVVRMRFMFFFVKCLRDVSVVDDRRGSD
jgi:hypothetical protein